MDKRKEAKKKNVPYPDERKGVYILLETVLKKYSFSEMADQKA